MDRTKWSSTVFRRLSEMLSGGPQADVERDPDTAISEAIRRMKKSGSGYQRERIKFIQEFCEVLRSFRVDKVAEVWWTVCDLLENSRDEIRLVAYEVMSACIEGQYEHLGMLRMAFMRVIEGVYFPISTRLHALQQLTRDGRDLAVIEKQLASVVSSWTVAISNRSAFDRDLWREVLGFLSTLIRANADLFDETSLNDILISVASICGGTMDGDILNVSLEFVDLVVKFNCIVPAALSVLVVALCKAVNIDHYCHNTWNTMRCLLKSNLGHRGLKQLCDIMDSKDCTEHLNVLRGAIFFVGMACWGSQRVITLQVSPSAILPCFLRVLAILIPGEHDIVVYEVILCLNRLVRKYGSQLVGEWDAVLNLVLALEPFLDDNEQNAIMPRLQETFNALRDTYVKGEFNGDEWHFFEVVERFRDIQPGESVLELMEARMTTFHPSHPNWISSFSSFMETYYRHDPRPIVKSKVVTIVMSMLRDFGDICREDIIKVAVLPFFGSIAFEADEMVARLALRLLEEAVVQAPDQQFISIIELIESAIESGLPLVHEAALRALTSVFRTVVTQFNTHRPVYLFGKLLELFRGRNRDPASSFHRRIEPLRCLLQLRADSKGAIIYDGRECPFLTCTKQPSNARGSLPIGSFVQELVIECDQGNNVDILETALAGLQGFLENGWILRDVDVGSIASTVAGLLRNGTFGWKVEYSTTVRKSALVEFGYQTLGCLVGYSRVSQPSQSRAVVGAAILGLKTSTAIGKRDGWGVHLACLRLLSMALGEIPGMVTIALRDILAALTGIGAVPELVAPTLEFLHDLGEVVTSDDTLTHNEVVMIFNFLSTFGTGSTVPLYAAHLAHRALVRWFLLVPRSRRTHFAAMVVSRLRQMYGVAKGDSPAVRLAATTIDLVARFIHSDAVSNVPASKHVSLLEGDIRTRTWLTGTAMLTVNVGRNKLADVCLRGVTGTLRLLIHVENDMLQGKSTLGHTSRRRHGALSSPEAPDVTMVRENDTWVNASALGIAGVSARESPQADSPRATPQRGPRGDSESPKVFDALPTPRPDVKDDAARIGLRKIEPADASEEPVRIVEHRAQQDGNVLLVRGVSTNISSGLQVTIPATSGGANLADVAGRSLLATSPDSSTFRPSQSAPTGHDSKRRRRGSSKNTLDTRHFAQYAPLPSYDEENPGEDSRSPAFFPTPNIPAKARRDDTEDEGVVYGTSSSSSAHLSMVRSPSVGGSARSPRSYPGQELDVAAAMAQTESTVEPAMGMTSPLPLSRLVTAVPNEEYQPDANLSNVLGTSPPTVSKKLPAAEDLSGLLIQELRTVEQIPGAELNSGPANGYDIGQAFEEVASISQRQLTDDGAPSRSPNAALHSPPALNTSMPSPLPMASAHSHPTSPTTVQSEDDLGFDPSFFMMQLHRFGGESVEKPRVVRAGDGLDRFVNVLELIPTVMTHKIAVLYVGPQQGREEEILRNTYGSSQYQRCLECLGSFVKLKGYEGYSAGLDRATNKDGDVALMWRSDLVHVVYHVATLMPNQDSTQAKKLHIGNDNVSIIFTDSDEVFTQETIPGQFNFVHIIVRSLGKDFLVEVKTKPGWGGPGPLNLRPHVVSETGLGPLVRRTAIHADIYTQIRQKGVQYTTNWEERLRQLQLIRAQLDRARGSPAREAKTERTESIDFMELL